MMMMQMMLLLLQMLTGTAAPALDTGGNDGFVGGGNSGGAGNAGNAGNGEVTQMASRGVTADGTARIQNTDGNAGERDALDNSLAAIAKDPEGAALLAEAERRGVTIEVGDPGAFVGSQDAVDCSCGQHGDGVAADRASNVAGVTLSRGGQSHIVVRDPSNIKTIVHELVHAVSTEDGNSKHEEGIADVVGSRLRKPCTL